MTLTPPVLERTRRGAALRESAAFLWHFIFVGGLVAIMVRLGLRSWFHFQQLHAEDGAVEMLTVAFFLLAAVHAHLVAVEHGRNGLKALAALHWIGALAFFVIGMEELSWGQRQLLLETPEALAAVNMQQELNLHNIQGIHGVGGKSVCFCCWEPSAFFRQAARGWAARF